MIEGGSELPVNPLFGYYNRLMAIRELSCYKGSAILFFPKGALTVDITKALKNYPNAVLVLGGRLAPDQKLFSNQRCSMLLYFDGESPWATGINAAVRCTISPDDKVKMNVPASWNEDLTRKVTPLLRELGEACREEGNQRLNVRPSDRRDIPWTMEQAVIFAPSAYPQPDYIPPPPKKISN